MYNINEFYCENCQTVTTHRQTKKEHLLNFIATMFTLGVWGFFWAHRVTKKEPWVCNKCNNEMKLDNLGLLSEQYRQAQKDDHKKGILTKRSWEDEF